MKLDSTTKSLASFHVSHPHKNFGIKALVAIILLMAIAVFSAASYKTGLWYSKPVQMVPDHRLPSPDAPANQFER